MFQIAISPSPPDPPRPAPAYVQEAEQLAVLNAAVQVCSHAGYVVFPQAMRARAEAYVRQAELEGDPPELAIAFAMDLRRAEEQRMTALLTPAPNETTHDGALRYMQLARLILDRCRAASERYPEVIVADGDELTEPLDVAKSLYGGGPAE